MSSTSTAFDQETRMTPAERLVLAAPTESLNEEHIAFKSLSPTRKNLYLLDAARVGDAQKVQMAIQLGAAVDTQMRGWPHHTSLDLAMAADHSETIMVLLKNGAKQKEETEYLEHLARKPDAVRDKEPKSFWGSFWEQLLRRNSISTIAKVSAFCMQTTLSQARALPEYSFALAPANDQLLNLMAAGHRWEEAKEALDRFGGTISAQTWGQLTRVYLNIFNNQNGQQASSREAFCDLVARQNITMPGPTVHALYSYAIESDASDLLRSLMKSGLRPGPSWEVYVRSPEHKFFTTAFPDFSYSYHNGTGKAPNPELASDPLRYPFPKFYTSTEMNYFQQRFAVPIQVACLLHKSKSCIPVLFGQTLIPRASVHPMALGQLQVTEIQQLEEQGFKLDSVDGAGNNFAHYFALNNPDPFNGWTTIARWKSAVLHAKNEQGKTPLDIAKSHIKSKKATDKEDPREAFDEMIARAEATAIRQSIKTVPKAAPATKKTTKTRI